jgi:hypothetical protein
MPDGKPELGWVDEIMIGKIARMEGRLTDEIKRLSTNPVTADIIQVFADAYYRVTRYLCHFAFATDHAGRPVDMLDVLLKIDRRMMDEFERLTGREYCLPVEREAKYRKDGSPW